MGDAEDSQRRQKPQRQSQRLSAVINFKFEFAVDRSKSFLVDWKQFLVTVKKTLVHNQHPELGPYIHILTVLYYSSSALLTTPVFLAYCPYTKLYVVRKCPLVQRLLCIFVQVIFNASLVKRLYLAGKTVLVNTSYVVPYFDFMNESVLNLFIYVHIYLHWFQTDRINEYVRLVQTTPLLFFSKLPTWKARFAAGLFVLVNFYIATVWLLFVNQVKFFSLTEFHESGAANAREIFWLHPQTEVSLPVATLAVLSRFYNCFFQHSTLNLFCPVTMLSVYYVAQDFFNSLKGTSLKPMEVLAYYDDYKYFLVLANRYMSNYIFHFVFMTTTFHSVHFFDTLNTTDPVWKSNMYIYIWYLWVVFFVPTKTLLYTKKLKRWLWADKHYLEIPKPRLGIVLHDQLEWVPGGRKGLKCGRFFVVSAEFSGSVIQQMWSSSLLVSLNTKH